MFTRTLFFLLLTCVSVNAIAQDKKSETFIVERIPEAPYDVNQYLSKTIIYPEEAIQNNIEGKVILKFVVNVDGSISNVQSMSKNVDTLLQAEAIRVVSAMPKWIPGKQQGKPVRVYYTLPVLFKLTNDDVDDKKFRDSRNSN